MREHLDGEPIVPPQTGPGFEKEHNLFGTVKPQGKLYAGERATRTVSIVRHLAGYFHTTADAEKRRLREAIQLDIGAILQEHWRTHEAHWKRESDLVLDKALQMHQKPENLPRNWHAKLTEARAHLERIEAERDAFLKDGTLPVTPLRLLFAEAFAVTPSGFDIVIANPPYVRQELIRQLKPQLEEEFPSFFCGTADLYTYFYARGLDLLREGGVLCYIAPNKFMRAAYGANTRKLLTSNATPQLIIDFGDLPIFEATTYPAILLIKKEVSSESREISVAVMKDEAKLVHLDETIKSESFAMQVQDLSENGWTLERPEVLRLMRKLREKGVPLGEYVKGRFYYGIKTGLNEAFVIDESTRRQLIKEDSRSAELIKPWLRGRDIKKWRAEWAKLSIIAIASSANKEWPWSGIESSEKAFKVFEKSYPAIAKQLASYEKKLRERDDQGEFWWELRSCAYYAEFERPKIVYPDIAHCPKFAWDASKAYSGNTAYILPTHEKFLVGLLNSSLVWWFYVNVSSVIRGNFLRFIATYMEQIPIAQTNISQQHQILNQIESILKNPTSSEVPDLETEIDELIFDLYELTATERQLILDQTQARRNCDLKTDAEESD